MTTGEQGTGGQLGASILLVEDEPTLAKAIRFALQREQYRVQWAADGRAALESFRSTPHDLVLLDIMLPGIDGLEICQAIRRTSHVPIMMITARGSEPDKVLGLDLGADDYLVKPFGMRELVARIRALLRRATAEPAPPADLPLEIGPLRILPGQRLVFRDGVPIPLRRREFDLLEFLVRHPGQVFSRDTLLARVWGHDFEGDARTVDVHIRMLREKVEPDPNTLALIHTVRHVGYCVRV